MVGAPPSGAVLNRDGADVEVAIPPAAVAGVAPSVTTLDDVLDGVFGAAVAAAAVAVAATGEASAGFPC